MCSVVKEVNEGAAKRKRSHWSLQDFIRLDQNANWLFLFYGSKGRHRRHIFVSKISTDIV